MQDLKFKAVAGSRIQNLQKIQRLQESKSKYREIAPAFPFILNIINIHPFQLQSTLSFIIFFSAKCKETLKTLKIFCSNAKLSPTALQHRMTIKDAPWYFQ